MILHLLKTFRIADSRWLLYAPPSRLRVRTNSRRLICAAYGKNGYPLEERVGRHLASVAILIQLLGEVHPDRKVEVENISEYKALQEKGVGSFLRPLPKSTSP